MFNRKNRKLHKQIAQAQVGFPGAVKVEKSGGIYI